MQGVSQRLKTAWVWQGAEFFNQTNAEAKDMRQNAALQAAAEPWHRMNVWQLA